MMNINEKVKIILENISEIEIKQNIDNKKPRLHNKRGFSLITRALSRAHGLSTQKRFTVRLPSPCSLSHRSWP